MSKAEVIHEIRRRNLGVEESFLASFPARQLSAYLARLNALQGGTQAYPSLARTSPFPAITCRGH